jgi:hypothetical protein
VADGTVVILEPGLESVVATPVDATTPTRTTRSVAATARPTIAETLDLRREIGGARDP